VINKKQNIGPNLNTENFPELQDQQVVLSRAETKTGIVLDEEFNYATNSQQRIYTIYLNIVDGISAAKLIVKEREDTECYIHDKDEKLLYFLSSSGSQ
jgi:hypothetical protein